MRKKRVKMSKEDADRIRILRQQYNANENAKLAGMIQDKEYQEALNRIGMEIVMLEEKYGLYEEL
ncbi:MAG: hypothetical protein IKA94_06155 [Mogibacterium sp.]|nr:hypothetical protein [Mogibacterium sp.]MBR2653481.1 hypothetical protein [Lachnospiraceae bacterium]